VQEVVKNSFCAGAYARAMEMADFFAVYFWPLTILIGLALWTIRDRVPRSFLLQAGTYTIGPLLLILFFLEKTSVFAVIDLYVLTLLFGLLVVGRAVFAPVFCTGEQWSQTTARFGSLVIGAALVWFCGSILLPDFLDSRLAVEGRVTGLRIGGGRHANYLVDIGGHTVKVTAPAYERLKDRPVVRAEVGRGSNYVYRIEYLSN
jgi:hypothetical protein